MPTPIIAGNWKMNTSLDEAKALVSEMKPDLEAISGVTKVLCPPFVHLTTVKGLIEGTSIKLGAQDMYFEEKGAFTGEVSSTMLVPLCQYVILGHSERRNVMGESDFLINKKVKAAFSTGLHPILCVGERLEEREEGKAEDVIANQLKQGLEDIPSPRGLVVAYEPVWAIGTGRAATPDAAQSMMAHVRRILSILYGEGLARDVPLLYGGSVTPENVGPFVQEPDVNGALVGGASLKAGDFVDIVRQTARAKV